MGPKVGQGPSVGRRAGHFEYRWRLADPRDQAAIVAAYHYPRGFLRSRLVPARFRSRAIRLVDAMSIELIASLRGRPGARRVRLKASRSAGRMAHTIPTLIP
jgi:hypothetical protein